MLRWIALTIGALVLALWLVGCGNRYAWHQKVTVEVETPEGVKSGASVVAITYRYVPAWQAGLSDTANILRLRGEAVALEVLPGKYLFTLVPRDENLAFKALHKQFGMQIGEERALARKISAFRGTVALDPKDYPLLVTFENLDDPASVEEVDPDE